MATEPKATAQDVIDTLRSIDSSLKLLVKHFGIGAQGAGVEQPGAGRAIPDIASERDLDDRFGNPKVRCDPRDWSGDKFKGRQLSECPAAYLDLYADLLANFFAVKNDESGEKDNKGRPKSYWDRKDASLARGWAARKRAGYVAPAPADGFPSDGAPLAGDDDSAPF